MHSNYLPAINGAFFHLERNPHASILCEVYYPKTAPTNVYGKFDENQEIEDIPRETRRFIFLNHIGNTVNENNLMFYLDNQLTIITSVKTNLPYGTIIKIVSNRMDIKFKILKDEEFSQIDTSLITKYKLVPYYNNREELSEDNITTDEYEVQELNKPREDFNEPKTKTLNKSSIFGDIKIVDSKDR